jgi:hypothetical protein
MVTDKKIALIICYFGKLPWYFDYFLHSCKYNPSVDFFIFTDDITYQKELPSNIKTIPQTLKGISDLASASLGFEVDITYGYKLCDFKPAYGLIFSEFLKGYDFWGQCDIDIIFGDIRGFITDELLNKYDLISVRHDWLSGCFLLFKNTDKLNTLFLHSNDYKMVFTSYHHYCFDETNFAHDAFTEGKAWYQVHTPIESMTHVVKKLEAENYIKPYFKLFVVDGLPGKLKWENGKLYYRSKYEIMLYHLAYLKQRYTPPLNDDSISDSFKISTTKIYR